MALTAASGAAKCAFTFIAQNVVQLYATDHEIPKCGIDQLDELIQKQLNLPLPHRLRLLIYIIIHNNLTNNIPVLLEHTSALI